GSTSVSTGCTSTSVVDVIGYGATASCFEGTAPAPGLTNTTADLRGNGGCIDNDQNSTDFTAGAPNPRNSSSPSNNCLGTPTPTPSNTPGPGTLTGFVTDDTSGAPIKASIQVSGTSTFSQSNPLDGGVYTMTVTGGTYTMLAVPSGCYNGQSVIVTIPTGGVVHQDFALERSGPDAGGYSCYENA